MDVGHPARIECNDLWMLMGLKDSESFPATFGASQEGQLGLTSFPSHGRLDQSREVGQQERLHQDSKSKADPSVGGARTPGRHLRQGLG